MEQLQYVCTCLFETEQMLNICKPNASAKINYILVRTDVSLLAKAQIVNAKQGTYLCAKLGAQM